MTLPGFRLTNLPLGRLPFSCGLLCAMAVLLTACSSEVTPISEPVVAPSSPLTAKATSEPTSILVAHTEAPSPSPTSTLVSEPIATPISTSTPLATSTPSSIPAPNPTPAPTSASEPTASQAPTPLVMPSLIPCPTDKAEDNLMRLNFWVNADLAEVQLVLQRRFLNLVSSWPEIA